YRHRCLVCEDKMQRMRENQRFKSGHKVCETEYRKWPGKYDLRAQGVPIPTNSRGGLRSADETGARFGLKGHPPVAHCLGEWWWSECDLYDRDGLPIARIVLVDGQYHLGYPIATPRPARGIYEDDKAGPWASLTAAKRAAEAFALSALPNQRR